MTERFLHEFFGNHYIGRLQSPITREELIKHVSEEMEKNKAIIERVSGPFFSISGGCCYLYFSSDTSDTARSFCDDLEKFRQRPDLLSKEFY